MTVWIQCDHPIKKNIFAGSSVAMNEGWKRGRKVLKEVYIHAHGPLSPYQHYLLKQYTNKSVLRAKQTPLSLPGPTEDP